MKHDEQGNQYQIKKHSAQTVDVQQANAGKAESNTQLKQNTLERPFAYGMGFYKLFWVFFIGCILGVVVEMLWCLLTRHRIESRTGLIYGQFNPVYGFGAVLMTMFLYKLKNKRDIWIFFGSMVIGGLFEYFCSFFQEFSFGTVSWEYSHTPYNLGGRTNLMFSFFWGILGIWWLKDLYPKMSRFIERIPKKVGEPLTVFLVVFMIFNMAISGIAVSRQAQRREGDPADNAVEVFLDKHYNDEYLKKIYPNMVVVDEEDSQYSKRKQREQNRLEQLEENSTSLLKLEYNLAKWRASDMSKWGKTRFSAHTLPAMFLSAM